MEQRNNDRWWKAWPLATPTRIGVLAASFAAVLLVVAPGTAQPSGASPTGLSESSTKREAMPPELLKSYVQVRTRLIRLVDSFMRTYRSCARRKGFLTRAWGACAYPAYIRRYYRAMTAMITFMRGAVQKVPFNQPCHVAMVSYQSKLTVARASATEVVVYARGGGFPRTRLVEEAREFVRDRNRATSARLRVNRICGAPRERDVR